MKLFSNSNAINKKRILAEEQSVSKHANVERNEITVISQ